MDDFKLPPVELGDTVLCARDLSDRRWHPACVLAVHERALDVVLLGTGTAGRSSVLHYQDPRLKTNPHLLDDGWVFKLAPHIERVRSLETAMGEMATKVARLEMATAKEAKTKGQN